MYLRSLQLRNFRSCADTTITLHPLLTVLAGENNAGKTNALDAIRLATAPTDTRRGRAFDLDDLRVGAEQLELTTEYADLDPSQRGLFFSALASNNGSNAFYKIAWAPPSGTSRRRWATWTVGKGGNSESEPEVRDLIRHVHLPALRDADRDLASSSPGRIEYLLRQLLAGKDADQKQLIDRAQKASNELLQDATLVAARDRVDRAFQPLSRGFHAHDAHLRFADATLIGLARDLRFSLIQQGLDPGRVLQTGLGYSNLLYLASILVELEAAHDAELTLLLVEEPEAHLHPQLQRATLSFLQKKASESAARKPKIGEHAGRIQVVVSSHSPNLTSATSVKQIVVLRSGPEAIKEDTRNAVAVQQPEAEAAPPWSRPNQTFAIAISELGLSRDHERKINRYLDVTKSTLLFGKNVLLVEGMAEALLLPALAALVLDESALARFNAASVIAIDGVDFQPYVQLLLTTPPGASSPIADRVVVITDEDPSAAAEASSTSALTSTEQGAAGNIDDVDLNKAPADEVADKATKVPAGQARKSALLGLAEGLGATKRLHVEVTPLTLEASLLGDEATADACSAFIKEAFSACAVGNERAKQWDKRITSHPSSERGPRFIAWMKSTGTRKGDFAQELAQLIEDRRTTSGSPQFPVPQHIARALRSLVDEAP